MKLVKQTTEKTMLKKISVFVVTALFVTQVVANEEQPSKQVTVHEVEESTELPDNWYVGSVLPVYAAHYAADIAGNLTRVAEPGTQLKKGDLLFAQDNQIELANVEVSRSLLVQERANFGYLVKQQKRLMSLANENSASQTELDEIEYQKTFSEGRILELIASLKANMIRLEKKQVLAPHDGIVVQKLRWTNEHADVGTEVLSFLDPENTEVSARIPFMEAANLQLEQMAEVSFDKNNFDCPISKIIPVSYDATRMAEVRVACKEALFIGSRVKINLPSGLNTPMLLVNKDSVLIFPFGNYLFRVNDDNTVTELQVELGRNIGNKVEIKSGLEIGDILVLQGAETLADGQKVIIL